MLEDWKTIKLLILNNLGKRAKAGVKTAGLEMGEE